MINGLKAVVKLWLAIGVLGLTLYAYYVALAMWGAYALFGLLGFCFIIASVSTFIKGVDKGEG